MITVIIRNSLNNAHKEFILENRLQMSSVISAEIHKYLTSFVNKHYDRDIRFYLDYHRNYVEEDIFKGLV